MEELNRFVMLARSGRFTITDLCEQFGISRKTGYKHLDRYAEQGLEGLKTRSCRPHRSGWANYVEHLQALSGDLAQQKEMGFETMSRGWAIGTAGWRKALAKEHAHVTLNAGRSAQEARELRESAWLTSLQRALSANGQSEEAIDSAPKFAPWKIAVAHAVCQETGAAVSWLCGQLKLGTPDAARVYLSRARRSAPSN